MRPLPPRSTISPFRVQTLMLVAISCIGAAGFGLWHLFRQRDPLSLAITSWPGYEYFYLAEQKRLDRRHGLELRVRQYSSLADQRQAFVVGDVTALATTVPEALAICQDKPSKCPLLVLVLDESQGADRLIGRTELQRPAQLRGRRVGLERAVLAEYLLLRSLEGSGLRLEDLQLRFAGPVALVQALRAGELDAIVTYAPHDTALRQDPRFHELFSSAAIPGEVVDVLAVDPDYARRQPQQLRALVQTWWTARTYAARHPVEAVDLMAGRQQIEPRQFRQTERGLRYPDVSQQQRLLQPRGPLAQALERMARQMQSNGRIRSDAPLPRLSAAFLGTP